MKKAALIKKVKLSVLYKYVHSAQGYLKVYSQETKLKCAIEKHMEDYAKHFVKFNEVYEKWQKEIGNIKRQNCATNEDKILIRDKEGRYSYTAEGEEKMEAELKTAELTFIKKSDDLLSKEVEIEIYIATELPDNLPSHYKEIFTGIVI